MERSSTIVIDPDEQYIEDINATNIKARNRISALREEIRHLEGATGQTDQNAAQDISLSVNLI